MTIASEEAVRPAPSVDVDLGSEAAIAGGCGRRSRAMAPIAPFRPPRSQRPPLRGGVQIVSIATVGNLLLLLLTLTAAAAAGITASTDVVALLASQTVLLPAMTGLLLVLLRPPSRSGALRHGMGAWAAAQAVVALTVPWPYVVLTASPGLAGHLLVSGLMATGCPRVTRTVRIRVESALLPVPTTTGVASAAEGDGTPLTLVARPALDELACLPVRAPENRRGPL